MMFNSCHYVTDEQRFTHTIRGIQGALIASACFHIVVGFLGLWRGAVRLVSACLQFFWSDRVYKNPLITSSVLFLSN